jgi:hypothetical protein
MSAKKPSDGGGSRESVDVGAGRTRIQTGIDWPFGLLPACKQVRYVDTDWLISCEEGRHV